MRHLPSLSLVFPSEAPSPACLTAFLWGLNELVSAGQTGSRHSPLVVSYPVLLNLLLSENSLSLHAVSMKVWMTYPTSQMGKLRPRNNFPVVTPLP